MAGTVVDEPPLAAGLDRLAHQLVGRLEHRVKLLFGDLARRAPRRNPRLPERLRLPEVADAGDEPLIEQRVPDLAPLIAPQAGDHRLEFGRLGEDVGPQLPDTAVVELEHGAVPEDRLLFGSSKHQPRATEEFGAPWPDRPASVHAEVVAEDGAVLEAQEQVLAGRLDGDQPLAVEPGCKLLHRRAGMGCLDLEPLAHERLKTPSDSCQGVAFRHCRQASEMRIPSSANLGPEMRRHLSIGALAALAATLFVSASSAQTAPQLLSARSAHGHLVVVARFGDLTPADIRVATRPTTTPRGALLPANVRLDVRLSGTAQSKVRWRSQGRLSPGPYWVEVSGLESGGVTDCPPKLRDCLTHWSKVVRVVVRG